MWHCSEVGKVGRIACALTIGKRPDFVLLHNESRKCMRKPGTMAKERKKYTMEGSKLNEPNGHLSNIQKESIQINR